MTNKKTDYKALWMDKRNEGGPCCCCCCCCRVCSLFCCHCCSVCCGRPSILVLIIAIVICYILYTGFFLFKQLLNLINWYFKVLKHLLNVFNLNLECNNSKYLKNVLFTKHLIAINNKIRGVFKSWNIIHSLLE